MVSIEKHLRRFVRSFPQEMKKDFLRYRKIVHKKEYRGNDAKFDRPYWLLLPLWLIKAYCGNTKRHKNRNRFLNEVLWAQYCIFLFVRIQDDLFDGHNDFSSLLFTSDQFLFEAERVLSTYFEGTSPFWKIYRKCLQASTRSIVGLDHLQQHLNGQHRNLLMRYAAVSAIFKIGSAAVCIKLGQMEDFSHIQKFFDEMAIASQILDDFRDIPEDLQRNRFNYVASILLRDADKNKKRRGELVRRMAGKILYTASSDRVFNEIKQHINQAFSSLEPIRIPEAGELLKEYRNGLMNMQSRFHAQRMQHVLSQTRNIGPE